MKMKTKTMRQNVLATSVICVAILTVFSACGRKQEEGEAKPATIVLTEEPSVRPDTAATVQEAPASLADVRRPDVKVHVRRGQTLTLRTEGLTLTAVEAVQHEADYSVTSLGSEELPPMPQGMVNMTGAAAGYRLLPGGEHFLPCAELRVTYDPGRLPRGYTPDDIYTSYYDTAALAWVRLERVGVDTASREVVSLTTHFTDFVNELLKAPEMPETQAFVPTAMSDLEAVNPMEGLTMIQPPTANNNGTAAVSYPLALPAGRGGMQPGLALTYNSAAAGSGGWIGVGWDIPVPAVTLDTRWGVPRYNTSKETEIYLLEGEQLVAEDSGGVLLPMPHRTNRQTPRMHGDVRFHARTGDAHDSIVRHGDGPRDYWWEVVDRTGTTHYYGHYPDSSRSALPCTLRDDRGNIARWPLCESRDLHGNTVRYYYDHATVRNRGAEGRQLYLDSVSYTGHNDTDGYYTVVFCRRANLTADIPVSCNLGFKEITEQVLGNVYLKSGGDIRTIWHLEMENGRSSNYKNRLKSVTKIDTVGTIRMRQFLDTLCHCIRQDEDDGNTVLFTLDSHLAQVPVTVYDTIYDTVAMEIKDTLGNTLDTIYDIIPTDLAPHVEFADVYVYDTVYPRNTSLISLSTPYAGTVTHFGYYDAPDRDSLFGSPVRIYASADNLHGFLLTDPFNLTPLGKATALGLSTSHSWSIGGAATVGLGPVVCLSSASLGGNYTHSRSSGETLMTLVDLDGDGLADKVYRKGNSMYYCRQVMYNDTEIIFAGPVKIPGASRFMKESSYSNTFGVQASVAVSASAGWTSAKSTTSTYFADVNGDGLVDLVDNGQVLFNRLQINGVPMFTRHSDVPADPQDGDGWGGTEVEMLDTACGDIIFDGAVNDSIDCERIWVPVDTLTTTRIAAMEIVQRYAGNPDTLAEMSPSQTNENRFEVIRFHREWDCSYHDDAPNTDAVRVWVAPDSGIVTITSEVGLLRDTTPSRLAARHADGVTFTIQHTSHIQHTHTEFRPGSRNEILDSYTICDTCYSDPDSAASLYRVTVSDTVGPGDMIFFRLGSRDDRNFDLAYTRHTVAYAGSADTFDSQKDFIVSGDYRFQAPVDGTFRIARENLEDGPGTTVKVYKGAVLVDSVDNTDSVIYAGDISKDTVFSVVVRASGGNAVDWGRVDCRPYLVFMPDTDDVRYEVVGNTTDTIRLTGPLAGWIVPQLDIVRPTGFHDTLLYRRLFGPLYRGWGQFAYRAFDSAAVIRIEKLVPPDMLVEGNGNASDSAGMDSTVNADIETGRFSSSRTLEEFEQTTGIYSPYSVRSYWVEMTPDAEHWAWVSYGRQNTVGRDTVGNSIRSEWYSSTPAGFEGVPDGDDTLSLPESAVYDDPVPLASNGTPAKAVRKVNRSNTFSCSVGFAGAGLSYSQGENTIVTDYLDLNGDRYPDIVGTDMVQYSQQWGGIGPLTELDDALSHGSASKTQSAGTSYSASPIVQERTLGGSLGKAKFTLRSAGSGSVNGGGNVGRDNAGGAWMDINGDGLADFVYRDGTVHLNIGYSFVDDKKWSLTDVRTGVSGSISTGVGVQGSQTGAAFIPGQGTNVCQGSIEAGAGVSGSYNQTTCMMMDVNGDGLPDRVWRVLDSSHKIFDTTDLIRTTVSYNLGNGRWTVPDTLDIGRFNSSATFSESLDLGFTYGFTVFGSYKVTLGLSGCPYSGSVTRDYVQLVDVNADGLPDLVESTEEGVMTVRYHRGGRANLLKEVTNFTGSKFRMDYGLSLPSYDQPSRNWLMTRVTTDDPLNPNGGRTTITEYDYENPRHDRYERTSLGYGTVKARHVDPSDSNLYRVVERDYDNRSMMRRGRLTREMTTDGNGNPYVEKIFSGTLIDHSSGDTVRVGDCPAVAYPAVEAVLTNYYEGESTPGLTTGEKFEYDRYHNVVRYTDMGDTADPGDGLVVNLTYLANQPHNLIGLRSEYVVIPTGGQDTARRAGFTYDSLGKPVKQVLYNDTAFSIYYFDYDSYGNLIKGTLPSNSGGQQMVYNYDYDPVVHTYPVRIVNSFGETMHTTYDLRFWKPSSVTDPGGRTMTYTYDFAGRIASVTSPLNGSGMPSLVNEYHAVNYCHNGFNPAGYTYSSSPTGHPYSVSRHYGDNGDTVTETVVITDGFGRVIQTKKGLTVDGVEMMQVSGRAFVDAFGRTTRQYDPVTEPMTDPRGRLDTSYSDSTLTVTEYDVLDRVTRTVQPLEVTTLTAYDISDDTSGHRRFHTLVTDPMGNITHLYADHEGRKVQVTDALGGVTLLHYDNMGQLISSTDPEGFSTTYGYDNLGRLVSRNHPDAGESTYEYDPAGNIVKETNPLGEITYDHTYSRVLGKHYSNMPANDVEYTYDGTGRIESVVDGSGSYSCAYDALGNITAETRTIALPDNSDVYRFSMKYSYDSWGRILEMTYPDGEEVSYNYVWGGDLSKMKGAKGQSTYTYIDSIVYNSLGQRSSILYGNGTQTDYEYDLLHRLSHLTSYQQGGTAMQDIDYSFDNAGNITHIGNAASSIGTLGGDYSNDYEYDALHRLVNAFSGGFLGEYDYSMDYSPSGRVAIKVSNAYTEQYSRSAYLFYGYCDKHQPHAARRIFDESNQKHYDLRWDAAGNLGQVSTADPEGIFETARFLYWTEDNRMHTAVDEDYYSYYAYDHGGERRLKLTGTNTVLDVNADYMTTYSMLDKPTLYPSAYMVLSNSGYTKHYYAGAERVAARIGGGGLDAIPQGFDLSGRATDAFYQSLEQVSNRQLDENETGCLADGLHTHGDIVKDLYDIPVQLNAGADVDYYLFRNMVLYMQLIVDDEPDVFFYHSDHLGSASWITDALGKPIQYLQYLPYGEPYVDQRISGYNERFTFTGKERDEETGYGYFGARYMDHELMTMWLSVDPMADKYPAISPYAYCAWNPVSLVDPDGRDIWQLDNLGNIVDFVECEDYDCIHIVDSKGIIVRSSNCYEYGTISELCLNGQNNTTFSVCGFDNAKEVFEFLANYYTKDNGTPLEWAHGTIAEMSPWSLAPNNNTNVITTTHQNSSVDLGIWLDNGYVISRQAHNHPSGSNKPSDITDGNGRRHGDVPSALSFEKRYSAVKNYTYTQTWGYSEYDSKGTLDPRILNQNSLSEVKIK